MLQYANGHPNKGSQAVATALDMNRNRIRPWLDGGAPDAVRGLAVAHDRGWLDADRAGPIAEALVTLIAGVLASGSISARDHRPRFAIDDEPVATHLEHALDALDVGPQRVERDDARADELFAREQVSVIGRVLVALGCPTGAKSERTVRSLPPLVDATPTTRARFVDVYVRARATTLPNKDTLQFTEDRPDDYRTAVASLIEAVAGASVTAGEFSIYVSAEAARALGLGRADR